MRFFCLLFVCLLSINVSAQGVFIPISKETKEIKGKPYFVHKIEQGQTMYSICKTYQVTVKDIIRTSEKPAIQIDEIIYIPVIAGVSADKQIPPLTESQPTQQIKQPIPADTIQKNTSTPAVNAIKDFSDELTIAFLLPLYLNHIPAVDPKNTDNTTDKIFSYSSFLHGVKLAAEINNVEKANINLRFFDVYDDKTAKQLIESQQLDDVNLIVGPIFLKPFNVINEFANNHEIYVVNPLSEKDDIIVEKPFCIRFSTAQNNIIRNIINHIITHNRGHRLIVINDNKSDTNSNDFILTDSIRGLMDTVIFTDYQKDRLSGIQKLLSKDTANTILYTSDDEALLSSLIGVLSKSTNNNLYCLRNYELLQQTEIDYLNKIKFKYTENYFIDHKNPKIIYFEKVFYEKFQALPDLNAFIAFDLANHFIKLLADKNTNFGSYLQSFESEGLVNSYIFSKVTSNGFANVKSRIIGVVNSELINVK